MNLTSFTTQTKNTSSKWAGGLPRNTIPKSCCVKLGLLWSQAQWGQINHSYWMNRDLRKTIARFVTSAFNTTVISGTPLLNRKKWDEPTWISRNTIVARFKQSPRLMEVVCCAVLSLPWQQRCTAPQLTSNSINCEELRQFILKIWE